MYKYPLIYSISHLVIGFISYSNLWLIPVIIVYQCIQYFIGVRFFFLGSTGTYIDNGNNISHTIYKLFEYVVGFIVAYIYYEYIREIENNK